MKGGFIANKGSIAIIPILCHHLFVAALDQRNPSCTDTHTYTGCHHRLPVRRNGGSRSHPSPTVDVLSTKATQHPFAKIRQHHGHHHTAKCDTAVLICRGVPHHLRRRVRGLRPEALGHDHGLQLVPSGGQDDIELLVPPQVLHQCRGVQRCHVHGRAIVVPQHDKPLLPGVREQHMVIDGGIKNNGPVGIFGLVSLPECASHENTNMSFHIILKLDPGQQFRFLIICTFHFEIIRSELMDSCYYFQAL